jgi:5'-3' exonuclease
MNGGPVLLVDATGLLVRCSRAARGSTLATSDGTPTGTLLMFISSLSARIRELGPSHVVACWDGSDNCSWRRRLVPGYKAGRGSPAPNGEEDQACLFLEAAGIYQAVELDFEADDIIAACWRHIRVHRPADPGQRIIILSDDRDLDQLLDEHTARVSLQGTSWWAESTILSKYGCAPARLPTLRALAGDRADGIPGLPGIGPAKALKRLQAARWDLTAAAAAMAVPEGTLHELQRAEAVLRLREPYRHPGGITDPARWAPHLLDYAGPPQDCPMLRGFLRHYELASVLARLDAGTLWHSPADAHEVVFVRGSDRVKLLLADPALAADVARAHAEAREMDEAQE